MIRDNIDREGLYERFKVESYKLEDELYNFLNNSHKHLSDIKEILHIGKNILKDLELAYENGYLSDETYEIMKYLLIQILDLIHNFNQKTSMGPKVLRELRKVNEKVLNELKPN